MADTIKVDVVSQEKSIFSGEAEMLFIKGLEGELGIQPGHTQLLTAIRPGVARIKIDKDNEEVLYISGGMLEVQPKQVNILADTVARPQDVSESAANEAKKAAEEMLKGRKGEKIDYDKAYKELEQAEAQLSVLKRIRAKQLKHS